MLDRPSIGITNGSQLLFNTDDLHSSTLHDITEGEKKITGQERPLEGGPTATAQSILSAVSC